MNSAAHLSEIFSSIQGEGRYCGERMTFVRFAGCSFGCDYCDTLQGIKRSSCARIERSAGLSAFDDILNPVSIDDLNNILIKFSDPWISITGGEPLEQFQFLSDWLPTLDPSKSLLLETNGVDSAALSKVIHLIDTVSMDIKLPSVAGCKPIWKEHYEFLRISFDAKRDLYVKIVVGLSVLDDDICRAATLVASVDRDIPFVIQPLDPGHDQKKAIADQRLSEIEGICNGMLNNVRIQRQMHKVWGVL